MTASQRKAMEYLWFKYGNGGSCHSLANHKYVQRHVEGKPEDAALYAKQITADCRVAVQKVERRDYSELSEMARKHVLSMEASEEKGDAR